MKNKMFEYCPGRYVNTANIISANIYIKNSEIRVAIDLDTKDIAKGVIYTNTFDTMEKAKDFCLNVPFE